MSSFTGNGIFSPSLEQLLQLLATSRHQAVVDRSARRHDSTSASEIREPPLRVVAALASVFTVEREFKPRIRAARTRLERSAARALLWRQHSHSSEARRSRKLAVPQCSENVCWWARNMPLEHFETARLIFGVLKLENKIPRPHEQVR